MQRSNPTKGINSNKDQSGVNPARENIFHKGIIRSTGVIIILTMALMASGSGVADINHSHGLVYKDLSNIIKYMQEDYSES